jgi:hypothetical protein
VSIHSKVVWACLVGGMLLQLTHMILPLRRWDWARYLGSAALPLFAIGKSHQPHPLAHPDDALFFCGMFTLGFAFFFQDRLLPRLGEGVILMWTTVLLCLIAELAAWHSPAAYAVLTIGMVVLGLLIPVRTLSKLLKILVYGWFLLAVVILGVLQFHRSDLSLISAGRADQLDYTFAVIDGMAGAYIGVHAAFLFELLPLPNRGEKWQECKNRWHGYLDTLVSRFDDQQLDTRVALTIVLGIVVLAFTNHQMGLMPDSTLANLVLILLPVLWRAVGVWRMGPEPEPTDALPDTAPEPPRTYEDPGSRDGIGRGRHSRKHRRHRLRAKQL